MWQKTVLERSELEPELGTRAILMAYGLEIDNEVLNNARQELQEAKAVGVDTFNPSFEDNVSRFDRTMHLVRHLSARLFGPQGTDLSFMRYVSRQEGVFIGNLHHDWKYVGFNEETGHKGSVVKPFETAEIWRQIINLGDEPRYLQIVDMPLRYFMDKGIDTDSIRPDGQTIRGVTHLQEVADDIIASPLLEGRATIHAIPPYDGKNLYVFEFWASRILHAGITNTEGHFMAAAARWQETTATGLF